LAGFDVPCNAGLGLWKRPRGRETWQLGAQDRGACYSVDAYLAASVLLGLILNAAFGWWWADPIAALVIVFYGFKEGLHAWSEGAAIYV
jgi:divalent metal cation (Fe/Co/Zn/Cd) transporter